LIAIVVVVVVVAADVTLTRQFLKAGVQVGSNWIGERRGIQVLQPITMIYCLGSRY